MQQAQTQPFPPSIPIAVKAVFEPILPKFPYDELLRDFQGEVLIVQGGSTMAIFSLQENERPLVETAGRFIAISQRHDASFLVGGMTPRGGRFRSITRDEAIGKIGRWIFKEI